MLGLALAGGIAAAGDAAAPAPAAQEILVRFEPGAAQKRALDSVGATLVERMPLGGLVRARLEPGASLAAADRALERRSDVVAAGPNRTYELYATPNDTRYPELWGLDAIGAPLAWDVTQGSNAVVVAVVDTGADVTHPDLDANIWTNPGEIANGLDDDANGLVDDRKGWDFAGDDPNVRDTTGHGTHVAGTIGAEGDNAAGVTGVNWRVKVMPLRTGNSTLSGLAIEQAFRYACAEGARVVNGSFGSPSPDPFVRDAIEDCPGTLFVFAAGNESGNNDAQPRYPCNYPVENIVCVAASEDDDTLASFSNYGTSNVDLAAPGAGILSTIPGGGFAYFDGTSMASPHVAGAAALVLSHRPALTPLELKNTLLLSVDKTPAYSGAVKTGGRLNVARALGQEVKPPTGLTASSPSHAAGWSGNSTVHIVWGGATDENGIGGYSYAFSPVADFVPDEVKDTIGDDAHDAAARRRALVPRPRGGRRGELGPGRARGADPNRHVPAGAADALEPEPPRGRRLGRPDDRCRVERRVGHPERPRRLCGLLDAREGRDASHGQEPGGDRLARDEPAARRRRVVVQHPGGGQRGELERRGQRRPVLDPRWAHGLLRAAAARPEARHCEAVTREAGLLARPRLTCPFAACRARPSGRSAARAGHPAGPGRSRPARSQPRSPLKPLACGRNSRRGGESARLSP